MEAIEASPQGLSLVRRNHLRGVLFLMWKGGRDRCVSLHFVEQNLHVPPVLARTLLKPFRLGAREERGDGVV